LSVPPIPAIFSFSHRFTIWRLLQAKVTNNYKILFLVVNQEAALTTRQKKVWGAKHKTRCHFWSAGFG
jgi:hypothetical protein